MFRAVVDEQQIPTARITNDIEFKPPKPTEVKLLCHPLFLVRMIVGPKLEARLAFKWTRLSRP